MKKTVYLLTITVINLSALTQAVRTAPAAARRGAQAVTTKAGTALERAAVTRPAVARPSAMRQALVRYQSTAHAGAQSKQGFGQRYYEAAKQRLSKFTKSQGVRIGATFLAMELVIEYAEDLAEKTLKQFNMDIFDENLISDEFSEAIVRFYSSTGSSAAYGSAFIVQAEKEPGLYFVITAAHCLVTGATPFIGIKSSQSPYSQEYIELFPLIVDSDNDIAVLLLAEWDVEKIKRTKGYVPAIPASQLANFKPRSHEAVALQGYPGFLSSEEPGFYRRKMASNFPAWFHGLTDRASGKTEWKRGDYHSFWAPQEKRDLGGVSGGPIIALRDKKPQVVGVASSAQVPFVNASSVGQLPEYVEKAKKNYPEKFKEAKAQEEEMRQLQEKLKKLEEEQRQLQEETKQFEEKIKKLQAYNKWLESIKWGESIKGGA